MKDENESAINESANSETSPPEKSPCREGSCCRCRRKHRWVGAVLIVAVIAAVAYCGHFGSRWNPMGWLAHGGSHMRFGSEETMRHAEWMTDRLMSDVNASAAQKTKARGIADAAAGDLQNLVVQHRENRKALVAMLKEPTLDRNKLEALRAGSLHSFDEASKRIATAMGDLADVLTPAQRLQLAESMEKRDRF